jgi:DNA-binding NarL/FixJ family response regulator
MISRVLVDHFDVVGAVADGASLVRAAIELHPDVIVSDIAMPLLTGPEAMNELKSRSHGVPFVLVTGDPSYVERWIEQGAVSIVDKIDIGYELIPAVRSAVAGEIYLSRGVRSHFLLDPPQ